MKKNIVKMSLAAAILLSTGAYAGKIIGANANDVYNDTTPPTQFGFGGWNLDNVDVRMIDVNTGLDTGLSFYPLDGTYDTMDYNDTFVSDIKNSGGDVMAYLRGKDWPVGEPAGIKIINDDPGTAKSGKSPNCIMTTSYLSADKNPPDYVSGLLDSGDPLPTVCSSPFQSHKRFKVNMLTTMVVGADPQAADLVDRYGQPVDLVFNLDGDDDNAIARRYQVFQKINNYTGMRLDGYKIEVLDENGTINPSADIKFSLDLTTKEGSDENGYEAVFSNGLWGPKDDPVRVPPHFEEDGFFDKVRAGFKQDGNNTDTVTGGPDTLNSNYVDLFGIWLPSKWAPKGIFWDDDKNPLTDAELVAFWGTIPGAPVGTAPAWHKGQADNWAEPTDKELITWTIDPWYDDGIIEDTLNLGLNYVVEVGLNSTIGETFTVRITPRVAQDQTRPNYIEDDNVTYIEPPTSYVSTAGIVTISPEPTFTPGTDLYVGVADADLNEDATQAEKVTITVTADTGDSEAITLTETGVDSGVFAGTLPSEISSSAPTANDGTMSVIEDTVVTATYVDEHYGNTGTVETLTASTTAKTPVAAPTPPPASSGGGGCTYNPNSKNFDMTFLMMMALGLLYPFRRRFLK